MNYVAAFFGASWSSIGFPSGSSIWIGLPPGPTSTSFRKRAPLAWGWKPPRRDSRRKALSGSSPRAPGGVHPASGASL